MQCNRLAPLAAWLLVALLGSGKADAESAATSLVPTAIAELDTWLGLSPEGNKWRKYLHLDELRTAFEQGETPPLETVAAALKVLSSSAPELRHERFAAARSALDSWFANQMPTRLEDLSDTIEQAKVMYSPVRPEDVERRRRQVLSAMGSLERFLASANRATQDQWKAYLRWDDLQRETARGVEPDQEVLRAVIDRLNEPHEGLELEPFTTLRRTLRSYANGAAVLASRNPEQTYHQALDVLQARLQAYIEEPTTDRASQIAEVLAFLQDMSQAPHLVAAIQRHFHQPNLYITVSRDLLAAGIERDVDEPAEVREVILDTDIVGYGRTRGHIRLLLEPNDEQATLLLNLQAQANTRNVGVNGPVTIYSTGTTNIEALHSIFINDQGITAGDVVAKACARSFIYCIAAKLKIIERIAWRKARESQPLAEAIASGRATMRAESQFSEQVREQLEEPNRSFREKFRAPLLRRQAMPDLLRFSTTTARMLITARHATDRQLGSPVLPPPEVGGDLSVRIHESAVGNLSESVIAGRTYTATDFAEMAEELPAGLAQEADEDDMDRDWSITFRQRHPVSAEFRNGQATVQVHFTGFTSEGEVLDFPIDIAAVYAIESSAEGPKLVRQGRVQVTWPGRRPRFGQRALYESKFRVRFERLFREELFVKDITPPDAPEKFGSLRDFVLRSEGGWFTVGLKRIPPN